MFVKATGVVGDMYLCTVYTVTNIVYTDTPLSNTFANEEVGLQDAIVQNYVTSCNDVNSLFLVFYSSQF